MTNSNVTKPTIFIIDDNPEVMQVLQELVESVGLETECYSNPISFLEKFNVSRMGCILTDLRMPDMSGIKLLEELNSRQNKLPVIILSAFGDVTSAVLAMKMGAADFLCKPFSNQLLVEKIQSLIGSSGFDQFTLNENYANRFASLSKRERQVMKLVSAGKLNKEIAAELYIGQSTVEFHRSRMMKKMGARNLAELIKINLSL